MKHVEIRDLSAGLLLAALGLFTALYAGGHYQVGQVARMGPGFFPAALGWVLVGLGSIVALLAFRKTVHFLQPPPFAPRALISVLASIAAFSLLVVPLGLMPATVALTGLAALAERPFRLRRTLLLGISLALIAWLIFTVGLKMTLPAFAFAG